MSFAATQAPPGGRPHLGYVISDIHDPVNELGWLGVVDAAAELDVNLVAFLGGILGSSSGDGQANVLYDLTCSDRLDGLIIHTHSLNPHYDYHITEEFVRRTGDRLVVSSAGRFGHAPYVGLNQRQGMATLVAHLIEAHGYHRIAYLRGPKGHPGPASRYQGYLDALASHGLSLDERWVTPPAEGWLRSAGEVDALLRLLLDERGLRVGRDIQAFVADTDTVAIHALRLLQARGVRIPADVAVVGFNDIQESWSLTPPLTTLHPAFYAKSGQAARMLLARLAGEPTAQEVLMPCELVVRQSCGCVDPDVVEAEVGPIAARSGGLAAAIAELVKGGEPSTGKVTSPVPPPSLLGGWPGVGLYPTVEVDLLTSLAHDLNGGVPGGFLAHFNHHLEGWAAAGRDLALLNALVSRLRRHSLPYLAACPAHYHRAEDLWQQARVMLGEATRRAQARASLQAAQRAQVLREISQTLMATFDIPSLMDVLARELPRLNIPCAYVALYEDPQPYTYPQPAPEWARLVLAFHGDHRFELGPQGERFRSCQLLPDGYWPPNRHSLVAAPLYFQAEQIGFVLFGVGPRDGNMYSVLRGQISSSLKGARLFEEAGQARAAAERADQLKTRLLANVSHELRTPLNVIMARAASGLRALEDSGAPPSNLRADLHYIHQSAEHQLRLINDLLDVSRAEIDELDLYPEFLDPRSLLEDAFASLANELRTDLQWRLELPDRLPVVQADPVRLRQVVLNLLANAARFAERGEIVLGAEALPPHLHIWVRDTGIGIPADLQARIFEPFVTAGHGPGRPEGVGLGLTITRRLVALHHGSMTLDSQVGQGSTFHVYLPLPTFSDQPPTRPSLEQPTLLLVSSGGRLPPEALDLCQRQGWILQRVQATDHLDTLLQRVYPAALAWDMANACPDEWRLAQRLQRHPRLAQLPCLVYGLAPDSAACIGVTAFASKPADGGALRRAIESLAPRAQGTILVVDDDPAFRRLCVEALARELPRYTVQTAEDGRAALTYLGDATPSLILLDLVMPGLDGFDVLDELRGQETTRQTPVLILSHRSLTQEDVRRLEQHAHVTFQSKGLLTDEEFQAAIRRTLGGSDLPRHTSALVKQAVAYLHQNYASVLARSAIADAVGVSEDYLTRLFDREVGITPWEYLKRYRILRARDLLCQGEVSVEQVAHQVGFADPAYFSRVFRKVTGQTPTAYRDTHPH